MIDSLCDQAEKENIAVAGLYCDLLSQQEQTITNIMGTILKELAGRGSIPNYLREAFQKGKAEFGGRGPRLAEMIRMLKIAIASLSQVVIYIDALDECLLKYLPEFLRSLKILFGNPPALEYFCMGEGLVAATNMLSPVENIQCRGNA